MSPSSDPGEPVTIETVQIETVQIETVQIETPAGPARMTIHTPVGAMSSAHPFGTLALGHGAGGGITAVDLVAATEGALDAGWRVLLFEQPWRVAGRKVAVAPPRLDVAWLAALRAVAVPEQPDQPDQSDQPDQPDQPGQSWQRGPQHSVGPLVLGGRSAGARVACRTASALGAAGVIALAFPLHPPGRADDPTRSRAGELALPRCPLLVVQGRRDPFGTAAQVRDALASQTSPRRERRTRPQPVPAGQVVELAGDHALSADASGVRAAVHRFLTDLPR